MVLYGVDAHADYQRTLDVAALKAEGFSFLVAKATEGLGYVAPERNFAWVRQAKEIGLVTGMYHWLKAGDGAAQARSFVSQLARVGGPEGLLIQLDVEDDGYVREMQAWTAEWNRLTGSHPFLIYTGAWWWPRTGGFQGSSLTPYLWHSHYVPYPYGYAAALYGQVDDSYWTPGYGGWPAATFLQYSSNATAGGVTGNLDINAFRGNLDELRALTRPAGAPAPPPAGDDMAFLDDKDFAALAWRMDALASGSPVVRGGPTKGEPMWLVQTLTALLAGGGSPESAAIVAKMVELAEAELARDAALAAENHDLHQEIADLRDRLAKAASAEADALKG